MELRLSIIVALLALIVCWLERSYRMRNLPPGPRGIPLIGNIFDLPPKGVPEYQHWLHHKDKYGPLSSVTVLGQTMVIVHGKAIAADLLEKGVKKTSGRPIMEFALNLCGYKSIMASRPHDDLHRLQRKLIHQQFGSASWVARFESVQRMELLRLLRHIHSNRKDLITLLKAALGAMILKTAYAYHAKDASQDPLIASAELVMNNFSEAAMPMAWAVDTVPLLRYLPRWFPGASFQHTAKEWRQVLEATSKIPFQYTVQRISSGQDNDSFVARALQQGRKANNLETFGSKAFYDAVKWSATTLYGAGTDTTFATLRSFVLAMVKFPQVQAEAQAELDTIIGLSRLPELKDRPNLPYIDAIVKETYRWHPAGPLGLPHMADDAINYGGYYIPKGSYIIPAVRWFCHNPDTYTSPHIFDPSRFLEPRHETDPKQVVFGYGQRNCLGRFFADATIFQAVALLLAAFNIEREVDLSGEPIDVSVNSTTGLIDHVQPFAYKVTARNPNVWKLLEAMEEEAIDTNVQLETTELLNALSCNS